jgi:hypothetical protein
MIEFDVTDPWTVFDSMLAHYDVVRMIVEPGEGLVLPEAQLNNMPTLLDYGLNMAKAIHDLRTDQTGVSATLSFGGSPFWTFVPWYCIGQLECAAAIVRFMGRQPSAPAPSPKPSHLKLVS